MTKNKSDTCVRCHESTADSEFDWYCSAQCKHKNETWTESDTNALLDDDQREALGQWG